MMIDIGKFGLTKCYGNAGKYEQEKIICDDYKEFLNKLEAQNPNITAIIIDNVKDEYFK